MPMAAELERKRSTMVDIEYMRRLWNERHAGSESPEDIALASMLADLCAELAAHRAVSPLPSGPSVAERLDRCRDRAAIVVLHERPKVKDGDEKWLASMIERVAHAMLAAEREPDAVTRG